MDSIRAMLERDTRTPNDVLIGALSDCMGEIERQQAVIRAMEPKLNEITDFASKLQVELQLLKDRDRPVVHQTRRWKPSTTGAHHV